MKKLSLVFLFFILSNQIYAQGKVYKAFKITITGKGKPMLFIPGATCSGNEWDETVERYSKNYECRVFTLAGYAGVPPLSEQPYLDTYKNEIIRYIKSEKLKDIVLVGHSIGGVLSLSIAAELKESLQKVVIVDALPFYALTVNPTAKAGFDEQLAKKIFASFSKMDYSQLKASQLAVTRTLCTDSTKWDLIASWGAQSDPKTMAYSMIEMLGLDLRNTIATIKVPVLVMAAFTAVPQYPQYTKEYVLETYKQQYSQCENCQIYVTPTSRHFIMYDSPVWYFNQLDTFLSAKTSASIAPNGK